MKTITDPSGTISKLKCHFEEGQIRLTFLWPEDIEQVYIFKTKPDEQFDIKAADPSGGRLFTLQEYKKNRGYTEPRPSGAFVYHIFPFIRKETEDFAVVGESSDVSDNFVSDNFIEVIGQISIRLSITEKAKRFSQYKNYKITLLSQQTVAGDVLCYVKKTGAYPQSVKDGTVYFFGDTLIAGSPGHFEIKVKKDEYIRVFVQDEDKAGVYILTAMG